MLLANGLSEFPIKGNPVFNNGSISLPKNPPDCSVLSNWVFDNFILADEPFAFLTISYYLMNYLQECYKFLLVLFIS